MAKVKGLLASGLRGKVGDIVYRKRNGKTHAYVLNVKNNPQSPKQKERQAKFAQASVWAKETLSDPEKKKEFQVMAKNRRKSSAYTAAVSYFLNDLTEKEREALKKEEAADTTPVPPEAMTVTMQILPELRLTGMKVNMSFAVNKTAELWQRFMPMRVEIRDTVGPELYSVEVYPDTGFFGGFSLAREFEKWAAVPVSGSAPVHPAMHSLIIPPGLYAVFRYRGKPSEAASAYQFIYGQWMPNSEYELDDRPHFAKMGGGYKGEHPSSEEDLWIPVRPK